LSEDVRVILIKLADRLHNMRTLDSMSKKNQMKIASETLYLYAPLAHRLGLYNIKTELEDLSIKYTEQERYFEIAQKLQDTKVQRNKYIRSFTDPIDQELKALGFNYEIKGRPKSIYSILNKMKKQGITFEEVYDLFAIRIIVDVPYEEEKAACWNIYSVVTDFYYPNPDRLRDWISSPKSNGYESLHTTVMGPRGKWVEVQIRTNRMNEIAEKGYAAHWKYKDAAGGSSENGLEDWLGRVREILENPDANAVDFLDDFKLNLFSEEVFVFTPKGELRKMPANATALDFAFDIHSDLGSKCIGAKVNNKLVPLSHNLTNGDQVEIITSKKQKVNDEWLQFVVTAKAKAKIKQLLKEEKREASQFGKEWLERKFKQSGIPFNADNINTITNYFRFQSSLDMFYAISSEQFEKSKLNLDAIFHHAPHQREVQKHVSGKGYKKIKTLSAETVLFGEKLEELDFGFARCCNAIPGDEIIGFITVGEGIKVHRTNCPNAIKLSSNYGYRIIKATWANSPLKSEKAFLAGIKVTGIDDVGIISKITDTISKQLQVNMKSITVESNAGTFEGKITLFIFDTSHLDNLIQKIKDAVPHTQVVRVNVSES
ncbi:MAG: RelA/SpoT family protein, partial [Bacteroidota bacterium]|nr:RelA/SpoT family protein [Bacteroidota bacterium]MDX5431839.1 RelA/SpoT family protein [Bacteroidota bacterium]MDX5470550.1 RelA/SpoT family protein [Bacteroidota bacterium]